VRKKVLLIGASTGGPAQIKELLSSIDSLSCTIIIAQHMREEILPFFIKDLKDSLKIKVHMTPVDMNLNEPSVIVCSHSSVLEKCDGNYMIKTDMTNQIYTPDINKIFNSFTTFAHDFDIHVLIMTGIGRDGVEGAKNLKQKGARISAQNEKSSPVYGMPKAAFEAGIVDEVKSFEMIKECFKGL